MLKSIFKILLVIFILGIILAAVGGYLVTKNPPKPPATTEKTATPAETEKSADENKES